MKKKILTTSLIFRSILLLILNTFVNGEINFSPTTPLEIDKNFSFYNSLQCKNDNNIPKNIKILDLKNAKKFYNEGALFLDARNSFLFAKGTIKGALSVPASKFQEKRSQLGKYLNSKIVTFCSGINCGKSTLLAKELLKNGFQNVYIFKEGYPLWKKRSLPTTSSIITKDQDPHSIDKKYLTFNNSEIAIIDVRSKEEFQEGHLKNSKNIPIISNKLFFSKLPKNKTIIFICKSGARAYDALEKALASNKFKKENLFYFDGEINCNSSNSCEIVPFVY